MLQFSFLQLCSSRKYVFSSFTASDSASINTKLPETGRRLLFYCICQPAFMSSAGLCNYVRLPLQSELILDHLAAIHYDVPVLYFSMLSLICYKYKVIKGCFLYVAFPIAQAGQAINILCPAFGRCFPTNTEQTAPTQDLYGYRQENSFWNYPVSLLQHY